MGAVRPGGRPFREAVEAAMKAVLCKAPGGPEQLVVEDVPPPTTGDGQVLIRVEACGVNFADTLLIAGKYQIRPEPPFSPGMEIAGRVLGVGKGVSRCRPGDRVMAVLDHGGFAEEVVAAETDVFLPPPEMDLATAAAFPVAYGTSHIALADRAHLRPGEVLAVHGAAGGVGLTAVEIGKAMNAVVIASAGGAKKTRIAGEHGADHLIDYTEEDLRDRLKALTDGRGVDVVYDPVGGTAFDASLRAVNWGGRILVVGFAGGGVPQVPANILLVKNVAVIGIHWGSYRRHAPARLAESFDQLFRWYQEGMLRPRIAATYPLERAAEALDALLSRQAAGKLVVTLT